MAQNDRLEGEVEHPHLGKGRIPARIRDPINRDFRYGPIAAPITASTEPPVPSSARQHVPTRQRQSFWRLLQIVPRRSRGWSLRPSRSETPLPDRHSLVIASTPWGS